MRKFLSSIIFIALSGAASAADIPVKAPPSAVVSRSWTGLYVGGNVGAGWTSRNVAFTPNDPAAASLFNGGILGIEALPGTSFRETGVIGGVQVGYNYQFHRNWLIGIEADFQGSDIDGSGTSVNTDPTSAFRPVGPVNERVDWFGTVRARLGYLPTDKLLLFGTGGFAYGRIKHAGSFDVTNPGVSAVSITSGFGYSCGAPLGATTCFAGSSSDTVTGWTAGGGFEYAFLDGWSIKAEYLYVSLANKSLTETAQSFANILGTPPIPASFNASFNRANLNIVRAGVNYHF